MTPMLAAHVDRYGPPEAIRIASGPIPTTRRGEVLVRVAAAAVTMADARLRSGRFPRGFGLLARLGVGFRGPRATISGAVFSGRVDAVGPGVTALAVGDEVAGMTGARLGAHAEFVAVRATALTLKPAGVTHADAAAALFGGTTALHFLVDRVKVRPGQSVLVNGASGSVGSSAVQLAAQAGATVTALTRSANHDLVHRLGAEHALDYRSTPAACLTERFDVVFDAVGNISRATGLHLTTPDGALILAAAELADMLRAHGRVFAGPAPERSEHFSTLLDLVDRGLLDPLTTVVGGLDALTEAHRRIDTGRKIGNLVIEPAKDSPELSASPERSSMH